MKKIAVILFGSFILNVMGLLSVKCSAQNKLDTLAFMNGLVAYGNTNKGKNLSYIIDKFHENKVPIRFFYPGTTSPWIDPKGISYVNKIKISFKHINTFTHDNIRVPIISITVSKPYLSAEEYENFLNLGSAGIGEYEKMADIMKDKLKIEKVEFLYIPKK